MNALAEVVTADATSIFAVIAGLALVIAIVLGFHALHQNRIIHNLGDDLAKATAWGAGLAEANARMRADRQMPPPRRPMPRPQPEPPTVSLTAPTDATHRFDRATGYGSSAT